MNTKTITEATYIPSADSIKVIYIENNELKTEYIPMTNISAVNRQKVLEVMEEVHQLLTSSGGE